MNSIFPNQLAFEFGKNISEVSLVMKCAPYVVLGCSCTVLEASPRQMHRIQRALVQVPTRSHCCCQSFFKFFYFFSLFLVSFPFRFPFFFLLLCYRIRKMGESRRSTLSLILLPPRLSLLRSLN